MKAYLHADLPVEIVELEDEAATAALAGWLASFARPGKLFTAHAGLIVRSVGVLNPAAITRVLSAVVAILQPPASP